MSCPFRVTQNGASHIHTVRRDVPAGYVGDGIAVWKDRLRELAWRSQKGFIYDLATVEPKGEFPYAGEGWGLTSDGRRLIMSDGTSWVSPQPSPAYGNSPLG